MAHGGEAIAHAPDGRVVFVSGAIPGDTVKARLSKVKVRWARAETLEVVKPSPDRVDVACPAARAGAGCCDYSYIAPETQPALKRAILMGQVGGRSSISGVLDGFDSSEVSIVALEPHFGWRTRVRLGVDASGKAGLRRARSNQILTDHACTQVVDGLLEGLVGEGARRFSPGSEVIAVMDSRGERHVVETRRAQRGKRVERMDTVVEGSGVVTEEIQTLNGETYTFEFPATAFWQAHAAAPQAYSFIIEDWVSGDYASPVGWDLYGGVGAFIPAIGTALGSDGRVVSVDFSESATRMEQPGLEPFHPEVVNSRVETGLASLPQPGVVVLDPPRIGAGHEVVEAIASAKPEQVIHIGCDPATFSRDLSSWGQMGYRVKDMVLVDAFPGTHHFEVLANLRPA
ncbi:putative RNA methyltransferase [Corynebacterium aquatimens]|nr:putative RNA methyltransferase [Corynebacterium aquatimens]